MQLHIPFASSPELEWVSGVVFGEFLGLQVDIVPCTGDRTTLCHNGTQLHLNDAFFRAQSLDTRDDLKPVLPLGIWKVTERHLTDGLVSPQLPVLFGIPGIRREAGSEVYLGLDVLGSAFFMLSRIEELAYFGPFDSHDRYPSAASVAKQSGFLHRPIIDEYVNLLGAVIRDLWPTLPAYPRQVALSVGCDVDNPYSRYASSWSNTFRNAAQHLLKQSDLASAMLAIRNTRAIRSGDYSLDPVHTFDWMMDVNERHGHRVIFHFIAGPTDSEMDGAYALSEPRIRQLIGSMASRGHSVGLHGSYESYKNPQKLASEAASLLRIASEEGISIDDLQNRQHYLRWNTKETGRVLDQAGVRVDRTLGYAEQAGFRAGTCREYTMFDLERRTPLGVKQQPLIMMETSVFDEGYAGLPYDENTLSFIQTMKDACRTARGTFTLLWHNCHFTNESDREMYLAMIS